MPHSFLLLDIKKYISIPFTVAKATATVAGLIMRNRTFFQMITNEQTRGIQHTTRNTNITDKMKKAKNNNKKCCRLPFMN